MNKLLPNFCGLTLLSFCLFFVTTNSAARASIASSSTTTVETAERPLRVLIAPGHEPNFGGTAFRKLIERDLTVAIGAEIQRLLVEDPNFEVVMTRDTKQWNPIIGDYFRKNWKSIIAWKNAAKKTFKDKIAKGIIQKPISIVGHNKAPANVATRLFGINKWANENNFDIAINLHFDDENSHRRSVPGRYSGFTIYRPTPEYDNAERSRILADAMLNRLSEASKPSNLPGHKNGIIDEPRLIAIGEDNTSEAASLVIEYGFIYERRFTDPKLRTKTIEDLALKTYQALEDYRQRSIAD